jgi:hypothetical protein
MWRWASLVLSVLSLPLDFFIDTFIFKVKIKKLSEISPATLSLGLKRLFLVSLGLGSATIFFPQIPERFQKGGKKP